jgi:hypothetical protein
MIEKANAKLLWSPIVVLFAISPGTRIIMQMVREDEQLLILNVCEVADHSVWPKVVRKKRGQCQNGHRNASTTATIIEVTQPSPTAKSKP